MGEIRQIENLVKHACQDAELEKKKWEGKEKDAVAIEKKKGNEKQRWEGRTSHPSIPLRSFLHRNLLGREKRRKREQRGQPM